jgi:hypothetical protein
MQIFWLPQLESVLEEEYWDGQGQDGHFNLRRNKFYDVTLEEKNFHESPFT